MKKIFLLFLFIPVFGGLVRAQDSTEVKKEKKVTYGIRIGVNDVSTTRSPESSVKMESFTSYHATFVVDVPLTSVLSAQSGLSYIRKGQQQKQSRVTTEYKVNYVELPVNLVYKYKGVFVGAGPYAALALSGKYKQGSTKRDMRFGSTYDQDAPLSINNDDWEQYDFGINMLAGYKWKHFTLNYNFGLGLKDIEPNTYQSKNRVHSLSLGYMF